MSKKKVIVISDHAMSTSGVGVQTRHLLNGLIKKGTWTFRQLGAAIKHDSYEPIALNEDFIIKPINGFGNKEMIRSLLITEKPNVDPTASVFDNYQAAAWLPKKYSLTRLPSVSSLRALRVLASAGQADEPFIGFGDPVLNGNAGELRGLKLSNVYRGTQADIEQVRNLPELPGDQDLVFYYN